MLACASAASDYTLFSPEVDILPFLEMKSPVRRYFVLISW